MRSLRYAWLVVLAGCGGAQQPKATPCALRVRSTPPKAYLYDDTTYLAHTLATQRVPVTVAGCHAFLEVRAPGYFSEYVELKLEPGVTEVGVKLRKVPEFTP